MPSRGYTDDQILARASELANQGRSDPQIIEEHKPSYEFIKTELLNRRKWVFTLDILTGDAISVTDTNVNLGFSYTYILPGNVIDVLDVNPESRQIYGSPRQLLRVGIAADPGYSFVNTKTRFTFVDEVLHAEAEVKEVIAQKDVPTTHYSIPFSMLLAYEFAAFLSATERQDANRARELKIEARKRFTIAVAHDKREVDTKDAILKNWLEKYYRGLSY